MKEKTKYKLFRFCEAMSKNYWLHRYLFAFNIPYMFIIPIEIFFMHKHVPTSNIVSCCIGWMYAFSCWDCMRWDICIEQCKEAWRFYRGKKD